MDVSQIESFLNDVETRFGSEGPAMAKECRRIISELPVGEDFVTMGIEDIAWQRLHADEILMDDLLGTHPIGSD